MPYDTTTSYLLLSGCLVLLTLSKSIFGGPCNSQSHCGCQKEAFKPTKNTVELWPGGLVFYKTDKDFSDKFVVRLRKIMTDLENQIGQRHIEFVEAISPSGTTCRKNFVNIKRERQREMCQSDNGMQLTGTTEFIFNEDKCPNDKQILVAWLFAIGFPLENSRPARDKYVKFHPENLLGALCSLYVLSPEDITAGLEYDPDSFLHFPSCLGSCNGEYVVTKLDGSPIVPKVNLSRQDIEKLRHLYPAGQKVKFVEAKHCPDFQPQPEVLFLKKSMDSTGAESKQSESGTSRCCQPSRWALLLLLCVTLKYLRI